MMSRDAAEATTGLRRISRLAANLLDLARLDRGLTSRAGVVRVEAPESRELLVCADPDRLGQAIENLLSNAIRHSPPGRRVTVGLTREERADDDWAVITFRDQGLGIPAYLLPRIFERYTAGPESQGLGLGLYLARRIAEAHGGSLTVSSPPGQGTRFDLAIPSAQGEREGR